MAQICLKAHTVDKVLAKIPSDATIERLYWRFHKYSKKVRLTIPKEMEKVGVNYAVTAPAIISVEGSVTNVNPTRARGLIAKACAHYGFKMSDLFVRMMTLSRGDAKAFFEYSTKEIRDTADKRIKTKVLGLVATSMSKEDPEVERRSYQLVADMNPENYTCKYVVVEKKAIICSSMK